MPNYKPDKGYPFEVVIPHGLKVTGAILADQVKNLDVIQGNSEDDIYAAPLEREDIVSRAQ